MLVIKTIFFPGNSINYKFLCWSGKFQTRQTTVSCMLPIARSKNTQYHHSATWKKGNQFFFFFLRGKCPTVTCVCCVINITKVVLSTGQSFHDFPSWIFCEKWLPTTETRLKATREGICCSTEKIVEEKLSRKFNSWNTDFILANQLWRAEQSFHLVIHVFWLSE